MTPQYRTGEDIYEIRGPEGVAETSRIPFMGRSLAQLKDMAKEGYILYINGKRAKLKDITEADVKKAFASN